MWNEVGETLLSELRKHPEVRRLVVGLEREVEAGRSTPAAAARPIRPPHTGVTAAAIISWISGSIRRVAWRPSSMHSSARAASQTA